MVCDLLKWKEVIIMIKINYINVLIYSLEK